MYHGFCTRAGLRIAALALAFGSAASSNSDWRSDSEDVADLIYCHARGTDAIGDATTQLNPRDAGLALYRECFAQDAEFRV
jgi:hypothetical protein